MIKLSLAIVPVILPVRAKKEPITVLRKGLILGKITGNGSYKEYGV